MAKYKITYKCRHETTVQLYGKSSRRDYIIAKMEQDLCPVCEAKVWAEANGMQVTEMLYSKYKKTLQTVRL